MKKEFILAFLRHGLTAGGGALAAKGIASDAEVQEGVGALVALIGVVWSIWDKWSRQKSTVQSPPSTGSGVKLMGLMGLVGVLVMSTGCKTALQSDKIVTVKQRVFGVVVETATPTGNTPNVKLGFVSSVFQMIPTSTNGVVSAPRYMDTFDLHNGINPFGADIRENVGTGEVYIGGTNDTSKAIVPSPYVPK